MAIVERNLKALFLVAKSPAEIKRNAEFKVLLEEISYVDKLQRDVEFGNKRIFKNFKLWLTMEEI